MSNISKASSDLKKKLSFNDYSTQASKHDIVPVEHCTGAPAGQQAIAPVLTQDALPLRLHVEHAVTAGEPVRCCTGAPAEQHTGIAQRPKVKATYYLSEEDSDALTSIYIKRLQAKKKTDKSALIAEAIHLLYKQEME